MRAISPPAPSVDAILSRAGEARLLSAESLTRYPGAFADWKANRPEHPEDLTLADVAQQQPRFSFVGPGKLGTREVVGDTSAAKDLLSGPGGAALRSSLTGYLQLMERQSPDVRIDGISFANDIAGFAANELLSQIQTTSRGGVSPKWASAPPKALDYLLPAIDHGGSVSTYTSGRIDMSHRMSKQYLSLVMHPDKPVGTADNRQWGGFVSWLMRHEGEHGVSPDPASADHFSAGTANGLTVNWMSEALADTMAKWPGQPTVTAKALGLPIDEEAFPLPRTSYSPFVDTLGGLLELAGVDTASPAAFDRANEIVKGAPMREVPARLAAAIVEQHGLPTPKASDIERAIAALDGTPESLAASETLQALRGASSQHV